LASQTSALVVVTALAFDFTNGFHDTANAMATSIATKALRPKVAVALSGILNLIGAFLSVEVALTVSNAVVKIQYSDGTPKESLTADGGTALLLIVLAGLIGGIIWNLLTWLLGLPSSSSHALFVGLIGATVAGLGWAGVNWNGNGSKLDGVIGKVIMPALLSPVIAGVVAAAGTWIIYRLTVGVARRFTDNGFRWGQIGSASLVSLAQGTNDAQKTMGVITLALIASGEWTDTESPVRARHPLARPRRRWRRRGARVRRDRPDPAPRRHRRRLCHLRGGAPRVLLGIAFIVASGFGKAVSFEHIYPTVVDK
jgi:PiT family inorganic phosphate transporter